MFIFVFLFIILFALNHQFSVETFAYQNSEQKQVKDAPNPEEVAEAVKQEVFLKTSDDHQEVHVLQRRRRAAFASIGGGVSPNANIGGGVSPQANVGGGAQQQWHSSGIGGGAQPQPNAGVGYGASVGGSVHQSAQTPHANHHGHHGVGQHSLRVKRVDQYPPFDNGIKKECNSYYGRIICYRIYTNVNTPTSVNYTCWRIDNQRRNCTEIENIAYLRQNGFHAFADELFDSAKKSPNAKGGVYNKQ